MSEAHGLIDLGRRNTEAHQLGDALRVGNEPDVGDKLRQALFEPNAAAVILAADRYATQHAPWDVHGPNGMGEERLAINNDGSITLVNNWTNDGKYVAHLGDPGSVRI